MVWFKVDDGFAFHPKALEAGNAALGLWVRAGSWCSHNLTDGALPANMIGTLAAQKRDAEALIRAGLWERTDVGFQFVDWPQWQPTKEQVRADREATKLRVQAFREKKRNGVGNAVTPLVTNGVSNSAPTRPDPTRTSFGSTKEQKPSSPTPLVHPSFDEFWDLYPRKVGKLAAQKAYLKAVRLAGADVVLAGVARLANDPNLPKDRTLIPHANTWLNGGRWADEAYPAPGARPQRGEPRYFNSAPNQMRIEI